MRQAALLNVNGVEHRIDADPGTPLLDILRNTLGFKAAKQGCGLEQCYACAVIVDGAVVPTCATGIDAFVGKQIITLEGIGELGDLHPVQEAFVAESAAQCGFCIPAIILAAKALLDREPHPSGERIREALAPHLCRCGTHPRIVRAIQRAAGS